MPNMSAKNITAIMSGVERAADSRGFAGTTVCTKDINGAVAD
jgi:hypothetical protein